MRTLVDIPDEDLKLLRQLSEAEHVSRAELLRKAISLYLIPHRKAKRVQAFNLWADSPVDGLEYQQKIRREWGA